MTDTQKLTPNQSIVGYEALCDALVENEKLLLISSAFQVNPEEVKEFNLPAQVTRDDSVFDIYEIDMPEDTPFDELFKNTIMNIRELNAWQMMYLVDPGRSITSMVFAHGQTMPDESMSNTYNILNYNIATLIRDSSLDIEQTSKDGLSENFPALKDAFDVCQTQYRLVFDHKKTTFTVLNVDTFTPLPIKDVVCVVDAITQTKLMIDPRRAVTIATLGEQEVMPELTLGRGLLLPPVKDKTTELGRYYSYVATVDDNHILIDLVTGLTLTVTTDALKEMTWVPFNSALESNDTPTTH